MGGYLDLAPIHGTLTGARSRSTYVYSPTLSHPLPPAGQSPDTTRALPVASLAQIHVGRPRWTWWTWWTHSVDTMVLALEELESPISSLLSPEPPTLWQASCLGISRLHHQLRLLSFSLPAPCPVWRLQLRLRNELPRSTFFGIVSIAVLGKSHGQPCPSG